jgi:hypothetical protein
MIYSSYILRLKAQVSNAQYHQNDIVLFVHKHKYLVSNLYYDTC